MTARPRWSYVQARLQARHGERLDDNAWHGLEASRSVDQLIERARATPLRRFVEPLNGRMSSHAIERRLREAWRDIVVEAAAWPPEAWRAAVLWTQHLPLLPLIEALRNGAAPAWAGEDAALAPLVDADPRRRNAELPQSPLAPLVAATAPPQPLAARWQAHWLSLWPDASRDDERALHELCTIVAAHVRDLDAAAPQDSSAGHRGDLARAVMRLMRRHAASPAALFCHLVLVALDLERLRGALVRRRLFGSGGVKEAA